MKVLISACLLGLNTKYSGKSNMDVNLVEYLTQNHIEFFPLCPEQLGGLTTPREACEIESGFTSKDILNGRGRVISKTGLDFTENFISGAKQVLDFCKTYGVTHALLQPRSPSCGFLKVYDGTFGGNLIEGNGILAQLLIDNGIKVVKDIKDLELH